MEKVLNSSGQKARQRTDKEDRTMPYRDWLRTINGNGFFFDIDMFKCRYVDGKPQIVAITDLTRTDTETVPGQRYLDAITDRWFNRDSQAKLLLSVAEKLEVPAYLVLFPTSVTWLYVFSFQRREWKLFSPEEWEKKLQEL